MLSYQDGLSLVQESLSSLQRSGIIDQPITVSEETVLMGTGSPLDSVAFVTFITDVEDRLCRLVNQDVFLALNDLHDFNADNANLSAGTFARYLGHLTNS